MTDGWANVCLVRVRCWEVRQGINIQIWHMYTRCIFVFHVHRDSSHHARCSHCSLDKISEAKLKICTIAAALSKVGHFHVEPLLKSIAAVTTGTLHRVMAPLNTSCCVPALEMKWNLSSVKETYGNTMFHHVSCSTLSSGRYIRKDDSAEGSQEPLWDKLRNSQVGPLECQLVESTRYLCETDLVGRLNICGAPTTYFNHRAAHLKHDHQALSVGSSVDFIWCSMMFNGAQCHKPTIWVIWGLVFYMDFYQPFVGNKYRGWCLLSSKPLVAPPLYGRHSSSDHAVKLAAILRRGLGHMRHIYTYTWTSKGCIEPKSSERCERPKMT